MRISDSVVNDLPDGTLRVNDNQIPGFHLRIGKVDSNSKQRVSYYYYYRIGGRYGRQVNFYIGNNQDISAGDARRIALKIIEFNQQGKDVEKLQFEQQKNHIKLKKFWQLFAKELVSEKYKNPLQVIRNVETIILPAIGSVDLDKISHNLVELRIIKMLIRTERSSYILTITSQLKAVLDLAVAHHYLVYHPLKSFKQYVTKNQKPLMPQVTLSGSQLKGLYYRASKEPRHSVYLFCLRLQILTGLSLAVICAAFRQDIKGNKWLLRSKSGKLTGQIIPLTGPLKPLVKEILKRFPTAQSLYLFPGLVKSGKTSEMMDVRAIAKAQSRFIMRVHGMSLTQRSLLTNIERAMLEQGVAPLVVAYLFNKKLDPSLLLASDDPQIANELANWHQS